MTPAPPQGWLSKSEAQALIAASAPNAPLREQKKALVHAIKQTAKKGKVKKAAYRNGVPINVETGHPKRFGVSHMALHFKPGDTSPKKAARAILHGELKKDTSPEKPSSNEPAEKKTYRKKLGKKALLRQKKRQKHPEHKFNATHKGTQFTGLKMHDGIRIITAHNK